MSTLHVLAPPRASLQDPAFLAWLARGDRLPPVADARRATLGELFPGMGSPVPAAALRHACHSNDAVAGTWLCADPAWVRSEATGARLMAWPLEDVTDAEAAALAAALQPLFDDAGMPLVIDAPGEWCVRMAAAPEPAEFVEPGAALGVSMIDCLPQGEGGRFWRRLFTESQVLLHAHPVNAARLEAGKHPVNALWFWGAGALPATAIGAAVRTVASVDDVVRGLAKVAGAVNLEPLPDALERARSPDAALLDLDVPGRPNALPEWRAPFQRWLRSRRFDAVVLTFASGERFRVRHAHRLRFWRKA